MFQAETNLVCVGGGVDNVGGHEKVVCSRPSCFGSCWRPLRCRHRRHRLVPAHAMGARALSRRQPPFFNMLEPSSQARVRCRWPNTPRDSR